MTEEQEKEPFFAADIKEDYIKNLTSAARVCDIVIDQEIMEVILYAQEVYILKGLDFSLRDAAAIKAHIATKRSSRPS